MDKTSDAYGDMMRDKLRDELIEQSESLIVDCEICKYGNIEGFLATDGRHFIDRKKAVDHQYNLLRSVK